MVLFKDDKILNLYLFYLFILFLFEYFLRKFYFYFKKIDIDWVLEKDKMCKMRYILKVVCFIIFIIDK